MEEADAKRMMKVVHVCVCGRGEEGKILLLFAIAKVKGIKRCITVFVVFVRVIMAAKTLEREQQPTF